jgi:iron complex transport system substrate-binding protein
MTTLLNLGALILALALAMVAVAGTRGAGAAVEPGNVGSTSTRIVSLGLVSDAILADFCEPDRVVAVSAWSTGSVARRWTGKPRLRGLDDLEAIIALRPDLVLVSSDGTQGERLARLKAAGVPVVTLRPMQGLATYLADLAQVGDLLGRGAEARASGESLRARLARVADPARPRPRALYAAGFGGVLFGGTTGTSYHDVLVAGGCEDIAASTYRGWPQYSSEQLLALRPEVVLTKEGAELPAIPGARIIALPGELLEDPGPRLLEAAEALAARLRDLSPPAADPGTATGR